MRGYQFLAAWHICFTLGVVKFAKLYCSLGIIIPQLVLSNEI